MSKPVCGEVVVLLVIRLFGGNVLHSLFFWRNLLIISIYVGRKDNDDADNKTPGPYSSFHSGVSLGGKSGIQ
jgi:hypothetical protein